MVQYTSPIFFVIHDLPSVEVTFVSIRSNVGDRQLEQVVIDSFSHKILMRPVGHRPGVRPPLATNETEKFFWKHHGVLLDSETHASERV